MNGVKVLNDKTHRLPNNKGEKQNAETSQKQSLQTQKKVNK
jgi:hypothetical protein